MTYIREVTTDISGDGLHISTLLTVRPCTIMYCTYMYVFSVNKILFKPTTDLYSCMCLYFQFDSICLFSELFELVSLLSKQFYAFKTYILLLHVFFCTRYSNAGAGFGLHILPRRTLEYRKPPQITANHYKPSPNLYTPPQTS